MEEEEFDGVDIYAFFGVEITADVALINKKFRKVSLTCHPDHFPGDKEKAELFMKLKRAKDLLCDPARRKTYDAKQKAKKMQQKRKAESSEESKRYREKLDEREREYKRQKQEQDDARLRTVDDVVKAKENALKKLAELDEKNKKPPQAKVIVIEEDAVSEKHHTIHTKESYDELMQAHNDFEAQILAQMLGK
jgi:DnaJ-class molecular chaperone